MKLKKLHLFFCILFIGNTNFNTPLEKEETFYEKDFFYFLSAYCLSKLIYDTTACGIELAIKKLKILIRNTLNTKNQFNLFYNSRLPKDKINENLKKSNTQKNNFRELNNFRGLNNNHNQSKEKQDLLSETQIFNNSLVSWSDVYINEDIKEDILNFGKLFFGTEKPKNIAIQEILFLYGLPGMDKSNIVKGLGCELNVPVFIFDPLLLPLDIDLNYLVQYIEKKNTDCILFFKDFERFTSHKALFIKLFQLFHYGKNNLFKTNKQVLIVFSCSEDYIIQSLNIQNSNYSKMFIIQYTNFECRKKLITSILKKYEEFIDIKNINIDNIALLFKNLTNKDIQNIIVAALNKLILNYEPTKKLICSYYDIIEEYKKYIQNGTIVNSRETQLNKGLLEFNLLLADKSKTTFDDVIGLKYIKDRLSIYINIYQNPEYYKKLSIEMPRGILFVGQPGCGKTLLAKALATVCNVPFIIVNASDIINKYVGSGSCKIREVFDLAKSYGKAIIYIDEIDSIGTRKSSSNDGGEKEYTQTLNALLMEMDGFINDYSNQILVIGSTNRDLSLLEPALVRRFEDKYYFDLPTFSDRKDLFTYYSKNIIFEESITPAYLASKTIGYSSADVVTLIKNIKYFAIQNKPIDPNNEKLYISKEDFSAAYYTNTIGYIIPNFEVSSKELKATAIHELGHSLCQLYQEKLFIKREDDTFHLNLDLLETNSNKQDEIFYFDLVTIEPRSISKGTILGFSSLVQTSEYHCNSIFELQQKIITALGGYCAEKIFLGYSTDGVSSDLSKANNIAKYMVLLGMDKTLFIDGEKALTPEQSKQVENILQDCLKECTSFIESQADLLLFLVEKLLEKKILYREEVLSLIREFYNNKKLQTLA